MNKLYIIGALALSAQAMSATFTTAAGVPAVGGSVGYGTYTYTTTADCYSAGTATTLGMFNTYHQYYSFTLAAGTAAYGIAIPIVSTYVYNACYHQHLYNWMAQPMLTAAALSGGFGNAVIGYGYTMTGTSLATCTLTTVTAAGATTISVWNTAKTGFSGAQYQTIQAILSPSILLTSTIVTIATSLYGQVGPSQQTVILGTPTATVFVAGATGTGGATVSAQANTYWDFMQTNVIQGQTLYGRGGGSTTAPCGWYVFYAYELPTPGTTAATTLTITTNVAGTGITVNMWTDNAVLKAASAFALTAFAGLLF